MVRRREEAPRCRMMLYAKLVWLLVRVRRRSNSRKLRPCLMASMTPGARQMCSPATDWALPERPATLQFTHLGPALSLARFFGLRRYSQNHRIIILWTGVRERVRWAGCTVMRLRF